MNIDHFTVMIFGLFIKVLLGLLFFIFWLNDRQRQPWFAWGSATFLFGSVAAGFFLLRSFRGEFFAMGIGVAALIAAFACCWQGARTFDKRPPIWLPVVLVPGIWLAASLMPGFLDNVGARVVL